MLLYQAIIEWKSTAIFQSQEIAFEFSSNKKNSSSLKEKEHKKAVMEIEIKHCYFYVLQEKKMHQHEENTRKFLLCKKINKNRRDWIHIVVHNKQVDVECINC